jgi:hypothetical protein
MYVLYAYMYVCTDVSMHAHTSVTLSVTCMYIYIALTFNEPHACIHASLALHSVLELESLDLGVLAQTPHFHLPSRELNAIHATLLSCADTNHLSIHCVSNAVGLGVLETDGRQRQIANGIFCESGLFRGYNVVESGLGDGHGVAFLHERHTVDFAVFIRGRDERLVGLENDEVATYVCMYACMYVRNEQV